MFNQEQITHSWVGLRASNAGHFLHLLCFMLSWTHPRFQEPESDPCPPGLGQEQRLRPGIQAPSRGPSSAPSSQSIFWWTNLQRHRLGGIRVMDMWPGTQGLCAVKAQEPSEMKIISREMGQRSKDSEVLTHLFSLRLLTPTIRVCPALPRQEETETQRDHVHCPREHSSLKRVQVRSWLHTLPMTPDFTSATKGTSCSPWAHIPGGQRTSSRPFHMTLTSSPARPPSSSSSASLAPAYSMRAGWSWPGPS